MRAITYKRMFGVYEIADITEGAGDEVSIRFEEAFDGVLVIGNADFAVSCGICNADFSRLGDGVKEPKLYTGGGKEKIESFVILAGVPFLKSPDGEYVRNLGEAYERVLKRLDEYGDEIIKIKERLEQKLNF